MKIREIIENVLLQHPMYEDSIRYIMVIVLIIVATTITTIIVNYSLIVHKWKVEVITERTREFLKDSREYFMPLTRATAQLSSEANPDTPKIDELCFYRLCQYLNEVDRMSQVFFYFPKLTHEAEIAGNFRLLNMLIKEVLYKNEHDRHYNILKYFCDHSEYLSFKKDLPKLNEYKIFQENFNNQIAKDLSEYSGYLTKNLEKAVTEGYKPWHRFQYFNFGDIRSRCIDYRHKKRVRDLREKKRKV